MQKPKRVNKTPEQLVADAKYNRKLEFVKDTVYPALCKATVSIDDATQQLYLINTMMMQKFLERMKDVKVGELQMELVLNEKESMYKEVKAFLEIFKDMNMFDAKEILEGMKNEINLFVNEENKVRPLTELKTQWRQKM